MQQNDTIPTESEAFSGDFDFDVWLKETIGLFVGLWDAEDRVRDLQRQIEAAQVMDRVSLDLSA